MDKIVADFNAAHPNIEVTRESYQIPKPCSDVLKTALGSGTGPDIFYYNLGPGFAGVLAKAGLLMPLDDAYAEVRVGQAHLPLDARPWHLRRQELRRGE